MSQKNRQAKASLYNQLHAQALPEEAATAAECEVFPGCWRQSRVLAGPSSHPHQGGLRSHADSRGGLCHPHGRGCQDPLHWEACQIHSRSRCVLDVAISGLKSPLLPPSCTTKLPALQYRHGVVSDWDISDT